MKVFLVTDRLGRDRRELQLCKIVNGFSGKGKFEFYAFATGEERMESDIIHFLPAHTGDRAEDCLPYVRYIAGEERCFIVYEDSAIAVDPDMMVAHHLAAQSGITVAAYPTLGGGWRNGGVFLVESDYLELIERGVPFEGGVVVRCAEDGELNVVKSEE